MPEFNLQNPKKEYIYFSKRITNHNNNYDNDGNSIEGNEQQQNNELLDSNNIKNRNDLLKRFFPDILKALGDRAIKENTLSLRELEQHLQNQIQDLITKRNYNTFLQKNMFNKNINSSVSNNSNENDATKSQYDNNNHYQQQQQQQQIQQENFRLNFNFKNNSSQSTLDLPIVSSLIERGYLVDSKNWLKKKGFLRVGQEILSEIIKSLKADKLGMHETHFIGSSGGGNIMQENSKKYEFGNELSNININSTIMNIIDRKLKKINNNNNNTNTNNYNKQYQEIPSSSSSSSSSLLSIEFPLDIDYQDLEIYETIEEIQVATVYCIESNSTMKYSSMYNDLSRIEAAKRALWSLYILNKKFFPLDSIFVLGFGSVASKISTFDIPFLKTFETNADFLHYTNYQAAYRLAKKMLKKTAAKNKRIVMITDGHPSACFIDNAREKERIMKQRPYSHFYMPDSQTLHQQYSMNNNIKLEIKERQIVYLCYRYRQIDQYIGEQTIKEAKNTHKAGINIDTIMVSEDDTLLDFINELAKSVNGKSIYINPKDIDKILIKDYLLNKKKTIKKR